eukprot:Clim_evm73s172 gene=Clim_evmTU73s172
MPIGCSFTSMIRRASSAFPAVSRKPMLPNVRMSKKESHEYMWKQTPLGMRYLPKWMMQGTQPHRRHDGIWAGKNVKFGDAVAAFGRNRWRRSWKPNVQRVALWSETLEERITIPVTTHALKQIDKWGGLDNYLLRSNPNRKEVFALQLRDRIIDTRQSRRERGEAPVRVRKYLPPDPKEPVEPFEPDSLKKTIARFSGLELKQRLRAVADPDWYLKKVIPAIHKKRTDGKITEQEWQEEIALANKRYKYAFVNALAMGNAA